MPNTREKLIEVIRNFNSKIVPYYAEEIADKLIANGVTIQKWIPVTERLPEYGQRVLAYSGKVFKPSVFWYIFYSENYSIWKDEVTHWMPLPKPPKGE